MQMSGTLLLLGAGKMGGAMLQGWLEAGLPPVQIAIIDPAPPAETPRDEEPLDAFTLGEGEDDEEPAPAARFDDLIGDAAPAGSALELSLFDLGDEPMENGDDGGARRRGRRRSRGRRGRRSGWRDRRSAARLLLREFLPS